MKVEELQERMELLQSRMKFFYTVVSQTIAFEKSITHYMHRSSLTYAEKLRKTAADYLAIQEAQEVTTSMINQVRMKADVRNTFEELDYVQRMEELMRDVDKMVGKEAGDLKDDDAMGLLLKETETKLKGFLVDYNTWIRTLYDRRSKTNELRGINYTRVEQAQQDVDAMIGEFLPQEKQSNDQQTNDVMMMGGKRGTEDTEEIPHKEAQIIYPAKMVAVENYEKRQNNQLSVRKGQKVYVTHPANSEDMCFGYIKKGLFRRKKLGYFPSTIVTDGNPNAKVKKSIFCIKF